ncbi:MAG: hypothetical protein ACO29U_01575 [Crocinitomicaceae bacterium]
MRFLLSMVFLLVAYATFSQDRGEIIQQRVEFISEQLQSENLDLTTVIEQLNYYFDHPINLNATNGEELEELNMLTGVQINDLLLHRKAFGKFISIYELQSLSYWDLQTIELVLPFVRVDDRLDQLHITWKEALEQGKFEQFVRYQPMIEPKAGYAKVSDSVQQASNNYYYGNGDRYYARFRYTYKTNISVGITAEKDAGEEFFKGSQKQGFDFYSAHAFFKGGKYIKSFALGDYQVQIGQGLNLWSSYAFGKTADLTTMKRTAVPIRAYTSVDESRFLRGAAADFGYRNWSLLIFASQKKLDGNASLDSTFDDLEFVSTIDLTGLHRTTGEISKKNGLTERILGTHVRYHFGSFQWGAAYVYQAYDKSYNKPIQLYNQFDFRGTSQQSLSSDYSYVFRNIHVFGEVSKVLRTDLDVNKGWATMHAAMLSLDPRFSMGILYRNYQKEYQTFYNAGFSEGSNTQNEEGTYAAIKWKLSSSWSVNGYVDVFRFPWLKYGVDAPSNGSEILIQPVFKPSKTFELYGRFRQQIRQKNSRDTDGTVTELEDVVQRNYRLNMSCVLSEFITLKSRLEFVSIHRPSNQPEKGMLFSQDLIFKPKSAPFDLSLRFALFDTDSYDTRIYTFESNALYAFAVPAYYYQGSRAYVLLRYSFLRSCDLWVKYGVFLYENRSSISSGAEKIVGNRKSDLLVQLRISF